MCVQVGLRNQGRVRVVKTYLEYTSMENDYYRRKLVILQLDCSNIHLLEAIIHNNEYINT